MGLSGELRQVRHHYLNDPSQSTNSASPVVSVSITRCLEVANLIAVVGGDTTAHEVRQGARCHNCGVKGNNTYQIVYTGESDVAMHGAGIS